MDVKAGRNLQDEIQQRYSYTDLQIQSRKDLQNINNNLQQSQVPKTYKPQLSWQFYSSQRDKYAQDNAYTKMIKAQSNCSQYILPYYTQSNARESKRSQIKYNMLEEPKHNNYQNQRSHGQQIQHNQPTQDLRKAISLGQLQNLSKIDQVNRQLNINMNEREVQIMHNKLLSNTIYLRTQVNQLIKLVHFTIYIQQETFLKAKINHLKSIIRKLRIRSISQRRYESQKVVSINCKHESKIKQLNEKIKIMKLKQGKLGTKLALLQNYIKVGRSTDLIRRQSQNSCISGRKEFINEIMKESKLFSSPSKLASTHNRHSLIAKQMPNDAYLLNTKSDGFLNQLEQTKALSGFSKILKESIIETKRHLKIKQQIIHQQKRSLKNQLQLVKLRLLKVENESRKLNKRSSSSIRRLSLTQKFKRILSKSKLPNNSRIDSQNTIQQSKFQQSNFGQRSYYLPLQGTTNLSSPKVKSLRLRQHSSASVKKQNNFLSQGKDDSLKYPQHVNMASYNTRKQYFND